MTQPREVESEPPVEPDKSLDWLLILAISLPWLAVAFVGWLVYLALNSACSLPVWLTIPLAAVAAVIIVGSSIKLQGNDLTDFIAGSVVAIVLTGITFPVMMKGADRWREDRLRRAPVVQPRPAGHQER